MSNIQETLKMHGFSFDPILDGNPHRFMPEGRSDKAGWYIGSRLENPNFKEPLEIITIGNWATGEFETFFSKKRFSKEEKVLKEKELNKLKQEQEKFKQKRSEEAKEKAVDFFKNAKLAKEHPYLTKKQIKAHGIYIDGDDLVIPVFDSLDQKNIQSAQVIKEDGFKQFMPGGIISGGLFVLDGDNSKIYICEGYATAASIFEITGNTTIVSFNLNNLKNVVDKAILYYGRENIYLCADNDKFQTNPKVGNPGLKNGIEIALKNGINLKYPKFKDESTKPTDFNDLLILEGKGEVLSQLRNLSLDEKYPSRNKGFFIEQQSKDSIFLVPDYIGLSKFFKYEVNFVSDDSWQYFYKDGFYHNCSDIELDKLIIKQVANKPEAEKPSHEITHFKRYIKAECFFDNKRFFDNSFKVNLSNGVLDVKEKKLYPHSPKYFFKYKAPFEYKENAECPNWLDFLNRVLKSDNELISIIQEMFGYILYGGTPFLHKAFLLYGEGRNGKSTLLDVLKYMIGSTNYCSIPIQNFSKPFSVVMADGKLANIIGETTSGEIESEAFKSAVSGEELIAAQKNYPEYPMPFLAKIVFAANKLPVFKDTTSGAYERLCIIPFDYYLSKDERIPDYAQKYLFPEISGIMNWALEGLDRIIENGKLTESKAIQNTLSEYRTESDSVFDWMSKFVFTNEEWENLDMEYKKNLSIQLMKKKENNLYYLVKDFYQNYLDFCASSHRHPHSMVGFSRKFCAELKNINARCKSKKCVKMQIQFVSSRDGIIVHGDIIITKPKLF